MARLSTGQTFGETGRATSTRLLGAVEQMATPGMLAQATINQPGLQPQAAPVDVFQQTGVPTVGGPPRVFEPQPLPGPSQDMAALAKALGSFSPVLQTFGDQYVERLKFQDKQAELIGRQFAADLKMQYPGQQLVVLRDQLYRRAQDGDPAAAEAYNKVQALSPLQLAYANRYNNKGLLQDDINSSVARWSQKAEIDGTPIDQIPPGDPRLKGAQTDLFRIPNDPVLFAEMAPQIEAKYAEMDRQHATAHSAYKGRQAAVATKSNLASIFTAQLVDRDGAANNLTTMLNSARINLGVEGYQKHLDDMTGWVAEAVLAGSVVDGKLDLRRWTYLSNEARQIFGQVRVGPNGDVLLVDQLGAKGGISAALKLQEELVGAYRKFSDNLDYISKESGEDIGRGIAARNRVGDPTLTPTEQLTTQTKALQEAMQIQDPVQRQTAIDEIQKQSKAGELISANQQKLVERTVTFGYDKDPNVEIPRIEGLVASGLMDPSTGGRLIQNYRQLQSADMRPYVNAAKEAKKLLMEQEMKAMQRPASEGGMSLSEGERRRLAQRSAEIDADIEAIRRSGMANNMGTPQLRKELDSFVGDQLNKTKAAPAAGISLQPTYESPQKWSDSLGGFGRMGPGNRAANYQLQQQVKSGVLFPANVYLQNLNDFLDKGQLSEPMRLMIKRAGYQNKPAQFFLDQWKNVYPGKPFPKDYEGRMQELNGMEISMVEPARPVATTYGMLSDAISGAVRTAMDVVAPPAMAAEEMQLASAGPVVSGSNNLIGVIRAMRGANSFRGVKAIKYKQPGDYQSDPRENWFFDFNPSVVPLAERRARRLSQQDINALTFTALAEAGPTARGKLEVAANLINRSAVAGNKPIVDIAKAPGQYEAVFDYSRQQLVSAQEGRRIFGRRYDQVRQLIQQGI